MLMSLTMRLCPTPPEDSRGVTSVVAIPTPSFSLTGGTQSPMIWIAKEETFHYNGGGAAASASNRPPVAGGTCIGNWGRGPQTQASVL